MCGIAGVIYKNKAKKRTEKFLVAANLSKHRGPDFTGHYGNDFMDLVHHRLSIIDLNSRSNQPFSTNAERHILVYNGEIYNYRELAEEHKLSLETTSDTEVLFDLLRKPEFKLQELNGIFAFAFYDKEKEQLRIVRDRFGVKPLYYYEDEDYFIFASEAKVIYNFLDKLQINFQVLSEFLHYGSSISNTTIIQGVNKLNPGSSLTLDINNFDKKIEQYWSIKDNIVNYQSKPKYRDAIDTTRDLLYAAVKRQCMSDVQIGAYLSGGIDSSAIVAIASKYVPNPLNTFSVNFDKNPNSELVLARQVAKKFRTNHHEFEVNTKGIEDFLENLIFQYDEPFADPAMIPLHLIAKKASNFTKVVLQGDGGDEVFAGYGRHLDLQQLQYRKNVFRLLSIIHPKSIQRKHFHIRYDGLNLSPTSVLFANLVREESKLGAAKLFVGEMRDNFEKADSYCEYEKKVEKFKSLPLMQRMLYTDMEIILPHTFLEKVDKVNMLHSIEARVPFLDNELAEYILKLPQNYKIQKGITKSFLREVLHGLIPKEILNDRKKSFGTPISEWLQTTLYHYTMNCFEKGEQMGFPINYTLAKKLLLEHRSNDKGNAGILWRLLVLTIWWNFYAAKISNIQLQ
ncbi:MAG TPA: asparagine synthase (glutamine-hydrolyzing) [Aequorivita sp.]|nr:asparagine synthase (glutamine-hydrolyzing) [Aequorivita sp.]